jgi:signal transduction histidine kinase/CheY-like chemotaxis protein
VGRWTIVILLVVAVHLGHLWIGAPGFFALLIIPVLLGVFLLGLGRAAVVAATDTLLLLLLPRYVAAGASPASLRIALLATWVALGAVYAVHLAGQRVWDDWLRAQGLLEQAREQKVELNQALEDWANVNRQLALANERIRALRVIAEDAQKTKAAFVAKVSHELRTPLNMIIGLVGLMIETPQIYAEELLPELLDDLRIVHRNCQHLSSMVNDVLDLSQAEAGRLTLRREMVDLADIVAEASDAVQPLIEKKHLALEIDLPHALPEVYCDRTRIRQVILNLVSNAVRFTDRGGITVRAESRGPQVVVSVSDTGPGISPEDVERIFEPFCQGTAAPWRDRGGSGLGLSISRQFVELHGGRIWVDSELGRGTTFFFELPITPSAEPLARPGRWIRQDWDWVESRFRTERAGLAKGALRPRIVVCDEPGSLAPALTSYSDDVELVNRRDLAAALRASRECPSHMLVINAAAPEPLWSLVEEAQAELSDTPIVGCAVPPRPERALEAGASGYLVKPVSRPQLREALESAARSLGRPVQRVLVVDDDADFLKLLSRMLAVCDPDLEVIRAVAGEQALELMRTVRPDLVLLDIMMPGMDGWDVLALKAQDERIGDIPIVFVSAQDPAEQPASTSLLVTTIGQGLGVDKLFHCSLELSSLLLNPDGAPGPGPR